MEIQKILMVKPTKNKVEKTKKVINSVSQSVLPKELPVEKKIYFGTKADAFEKIKEQIQISIDNMKK